MKLDAAKRLIAHKLEEEWIPGVRGYHYAVGCILLAADTMKFSFQLRAPDSDTPNTYGCWGGSIDGNEEAFEALKRELREETGYTGELRIYPLMTYYDADKGFTYYNNLVVIPMQMEVAKNGESAGDIWVPYGEWPTPLHPGLQSLLDDRPSMFTVEQVMKSIERAEANGQDPMRTFAAHRLLAAVEYVAQIPPKFENQKYKEQGGIVTETTPAKWLAAALRLEIDPGSQNKIDALKMKIKAGTPLDPPTLFLKNGRVVKHSGRHRAAAALQLGIETIPIILIPLEGDVTKTVQSQKTGKIIEL